MTTEFRNLEAEQRRAALTNAQMAEYLSISRATYESKKQTGSFSRPQIEKMLTLFRCTFEYLFSVEPTYPNE